MVWVSTSAGSFCSQHFPFNNMWLLRVPLKEFCTFCLGYIISFVWNTHLSYLLGEVFLSLTIFNLHGDLPEPFLSFSSQLEAEWNICFSYHFVYYSIYKLHFKCFTKYISSSLSPSCIWIVLFILVFCILAQGLTHTVGIK